MAGAEVVTVGRDVGGSKLKCVRTGGGLNGEPPSLVRLAVVRGPRELLGGGGKKP